MLQTVFSALGACAIIVGAGVCAAAQTPAASPSTTETANESSLRTETNAEIEEIRRLLREQQQELEQMRAVVTRQTVMIDELRRRVEQNERRAAAAEPPGDAPPAQIIPAGGASPEGAARAGDGSRADQIDARLARVEEQAKRASEALSKQLGSITFSGDLRFRYELLTGQLNASAHSGDPSILGNELTARNRLRVRARLAVRGRISEEFEWGLRLVTGSFADAVSGNQTLTDFYNRKPFSLDQAYLSYRPSAVPGLQLQAGKFEAPWMRTELIFDGDLQHEGVSESYARDFQGSALRNLTFVAWQMPFLERNSAFVQNADGTASLGESRREGRDLALFGAQGRVRLQPADTTALTLAVSSFYFSGTQYITPAQLLGGQLQLPVMVSIPATANSPAQTVTALAVIPRDLLVAGHASLGLSTATTNATGRDGRLASGFNLLNLIGRLEVTRSKRYPVTLTFDFVTNTQARDVTTAGTSGATLRQRNDEDKGYWAEVQIGKTRERGDVLFAYTFMRIEKDAVLTPFNFDELVQASDVRAQRFSFSYAVDPRVVLTLTGLFSRRANGLLGPFGATPPGSLNRPTTRLQLDTIFRF